MNYKKILFWAVFPLSLLIFIVCGIAYNIGQLGASVAKLLNKFENWAMGYTNINWDDLIS